MIFSADTCIYAHTPTHIYTRLHVCEDVQIKIIFYTHTLLKIHTRTIYYLIPLSPVLEFL